MPDHDIDKQILRLDGYRVASEQINQNLVPSPEHIAIEQALALAYIARGLDTSRRP